jgi:hypothetical protein
MTPFYNSDSIHEGRCFFACVASILHLEDMAELDKHKFEDATWFEDVNKAFKELGIEYMMTTDLNAIAVSDGAEVILCLEKGNVGHAVVARAEQRSFQGLDLEWQVKTLFQVIHDPGDGSTLTRELSENEVKSVWFF